MDIACYAWSFPIVPETARATYIGKARALHNQTHRIAVKLLDRYRFHIHTKGSRSWNENKLNQTVHFLTATTRTTTNGPLKTDIAFIVTESQPETLAQRLFQ